MEEKKKGSKLNFIFAGDIMTEEVVVVNSTMNIGHVTHLMLRERVSGYPVVNEDGKVIGIVTLTDLFKLIHKIFKSSEAVTGESDSLLLEEAIDEVKNKPIHEIMSHEVRTIESATPFSEIIQMVVDEDIHTFPVMKDGKLVGIIGRHDILNTTFIYG